MSDKLQQAINDLRNVPKIDIHGKPYTSVAARVEVFRRYFPDASLETEVIHDDEMRVVLKATIAVNGTIVATGYAEELRGEGKINTTSALENAETSAIGRALAAMGIHGGEYASHNEVQQAISQQKSIPKPKSTPVSGATAANHSFSALERIGLQVQTFEHELIVSGKTYGHQQLLKQQGFRWDASRKVWHQPLQEAA